MVLTAGCQHVFSLPSFPGLPPPSRFWSLAVCKNGGEGLVHFIMWMTSVPTYIVHVGRQRGGGVPYWKNEVEACSWPKPWRFERLLYEKCTAPGLKRITRAWNAFFLPGKTLPPSVYLGRYYQAFPLRFFFFCILQAIKNWMVGRPGKEAMSSPQVSKQIVST